MKTKKKISAILATLMLVLSVFLVIPLPVSAGDTVVVLPLWAESSLPYLLHFYPLNNTGSVNYMLIAINSTTRTEKLTNWTLTMSYNPKVLKMLAAKEGYTGVYGGFLNRSVYDNGVYNATATAALRAAFGGGPTTFGYSLALNASTGRMDVRITCAQTGGTASGFMLPAYCPLPNGLDILGLVVWMTIDYGKSPILLSGFYLDDVGSPGGIYFPPGWATGEQGYYALVRHTASVREALPLIWREPPHSAGETFTIPLSIITSEAVHSWTASVWWDASVVQCNGATEGSFLMHWGVPYYPPGNTTWTTPVINNPAGTASLGCHLDPGLSATGHGALADLTFQALGYGQTDIIITAMSTKNTSDSEIYTLAGYPLDYSEKGYFEFYKEVEVGFNPDSIDWTGVAGKAIGQTFTVDLTISTSHEVHAWKAGFRFNPFVLECTSVTEGPWLATSGATTWIGGTINNTKGEVTSSSCTLDTAGANATGAGVLATIEFKVVGYGETGLELTYVIGDPAETELKDPGLNKIPIDKLVNGYFRFRTGVSISLWVGTPAKPFIGSWGWSVTDTFTMDLKISTMEKVSSWSVGFRFDPSVLNVVSVVQGPWLATGGTTTWLPGTIDNATGVVSAYGETLQVEDKFATGTGVLATITFQVVGAGWTTINITNLDLDACEALVYDRGWPGIHPRDECDFLRLVDGLKLYGDVDGDAYVGPTDVWTHVAPAYGTYETTIGSTYKANCDFDGDGYVGPTDVWTYLAPNYGQYPTYTASNDFSGDA